MKEKIFNALKTAILIGGKTSVSDATINTFVGLIDVEKITDESQIAETIKPYVPLLQATQANINSVAATSVTTKESALKAEYEQKIKDLERKNPNPNPTLDDLEAKIAAAVKVAVETAVNPLSSTVQTLQGEKLQQELSQKLNSLLTEKKVPEWYATDILDGRTFKDESDVNSWAEKISTKWGERNQILANNGFKETVPPGSGDGEVKEIDAFAASISAGTQKIVEQTKN